MARTVSVKKLREYADILKSRRVREVLRLLADAVEGALPLSGQPLIDLDEIAFAQEQTERKHNQSPQ